MKLIYAIVSHEDDTQVIHALNQKGINVTKIGSAGGFLRTGNTTLMIGVKEDKVDSTIAIIKKECGKRHQLVVNTIPSMAMVSYMAEPIEIEVGGAVIFVIDVERFERV